MKKDGSGDTIMEETIRLIRLRVRKYEAGFSLIEVMVTIGIIAIVAATAIPGFSVWLPNYRLKSAVQDIYSNMQKAKMDAIRAGKKQGYTIQFNTGNNSYSLIPPTGTASTVNLADYGSNITFGRPDTGSAVEYTDSKVNFSSRGMTDQDEKWVHLKNEKNNYYRVGTSRTGVIQLRRWNGSTWS